MQNVNLLTIFITGLLTGGLTCMAVQGGLLAATIAQATEDKLKAQAKGGNAMPILAFLLAKLLAYTLLGLLLGWLGSFFSLSIPVKVTLQIAVAIFMIGTALNILNVHPFFRYFAIQPPRFLARMVRKQSKKTSIFAPIILGAFTVFIPCGTTQAMMALAIATGNPAYGALILFAFVLGTSPVFFLLGYFATKLADTFHEKFMRLAAVAILLLAVFNINNAIAQTGTPYTLDGFARSAWCTIAWCGQTDSAPVTTPISEANLIIESSGYTPNALTVKAGSNVKLHLTNKDGASCVQAFTIPSLNIEQVVPVGGTSDVTFTAPAKKGDIAFMCSMGMYRGVIHVL